MAKYVKKYGARAAVEVANFEASQVHAVKELVEREQIDCDFVLTRACDATLHRGLADETEAAFAELQKSGLTDFKDVYHPRAKDAERVSFDSRNRCDGSKQKLNAIRDRSLVSRVL